MVVFVRAVSYCTYKHKITQNYTKFFNSIFSVFLLTLNFSIFFFIQNHGSKTQFLIQTQITPVAPNQTLLPRRSLVSRVRAVGRRRKKKWQIMVERSREGRASHTAAPASLCLEDLVGWWLCVLRSWVHYNVRERSVNWAYFTWCSSRVSTREQAFKALDQDVYALGRLFAYGLS